MKRILLLGIVLAWCSHDLLFAQLNKGSNYKSGTISFGGLHSKPVTDSYTTTNQLSLNPSIQMGHFFADNKMFGVGIGSSLYFLWGNGSTGATDTKFSSNEIGYSLSPFVRHYKSLSPKWAIFLSSSVQFSYLTSKTRYGDSKTNDNGYSAGLQVLPGVAYWVSPRFALESDINLLSVGAGYKDYGDTKSLYFNSSVTSELTSYFSIRASWYLTKP